MSCLKLINQACHILLICYCFFLKLFGLIPVKLDFKRKVAHQHRPSFVYSIVVTIVVALSYPLSRIYMYQAIVDSKMFNQRSLSAIVGAINGITLSATAVIIVFQTTWRRKLLTEYLSLRFKIIDQFRELGFFTAKDNNVKMLFLFMLCKILIGLISKVFVQFLVVRKIFKPELLTWKVNLSIWTMLIPQVVLVLSKNFFFEGIVFLNVLLEYMEREGRKRLANVVGRKHNHTQSHQIWDTIDRLSSLYGQIFRLKWMLNRFSSFFLVIVIGQVLLDLTVQSYYQYQQYFNPLQLFGTIKPLGASYYLIMQTVSDYLDFWVTLYACQMLLKQRISLIEMTLEMYELNLEEAATSYLDLFNIQLIHEPMSILACDMFQVDLPMLTRMAVAHSNYLLILIQFA